MTDTIHVIVAMTWHPNDDPTLEVNHLDGIRDNNIPSNLEWTTHLANVRHGRGCKLSPLDVETIKFLRKAGMLLKEIGYHYKIKPSSVSAICTGKRRKNG